jgi:protein required for attachment to host cells
MKSRSKNMSADIHVLENESLKKELCERPDRRELLDKLGKLAVYTPPVMLGLMMSSRASAASLRPPCDPYKSNC